MTVIPDKPLLPEDPEQAPPVTQNENLNIGTLKAPRFRVEMGSLEEDDSTCIKAPRVFLRQALKAPQAYSYQVFRDTMSEEDSLEGENLYGIYFEFAGDDNRLSPGSTLYCLYSFDDVSWFHAAIFSDANVENGDSTEDYISLDRDNPDFVNRVFSGDRGVVFPLPDSIDLSDDASFSLRVAFVLETDITGGMVSEGLDVINIDFDSIEIYEIDLGGGGGLASGTTSPPKGPIRSAS